MSGCKFNEALVRAALALQDERLPPQWPVGIVRDVYGKLRFAVDAWRPLAEDEEAEGPRTAAKPDDIYPAAAFELLGRLRELSPYSIVGGLVSRDDFPIRLHYFNTRIGIKPWLPCQPQRRRTAARCFREIMVRLLDRQVIGQDWLRTRRFDEHGHPPRVVFYGLKGGVGRSTALAMLAYRLARDGKRVLLIDFDLESPGLSGLLLPQEQVATYGLVDWFVKDAVGGDEVLRDMSSLSPLADQTQGSIRVAAAMGQGETAYLSKLAGLRRHAIANGTADFRDRMLRITRLLKLRAARHCPHRQPAGLHDVALPSAAWPRWRCCLPPMRSRTGKATGSCSITGTSARQCCARCVSAS
jgi:hypothetical protein